MSLVVEDGTGLANAESYAAVSEADTYHANLGNDTWAPLATAVKEAKLRQATNYMMQKYRGRWKGWRVNTVQAQDWPRIGVYLNDVAAFPQHGRLSSFAYMVPATSVPQMVKNACMELALIAIDGPLTPRSLTQNIESQKVGPIVTQYDKYSPQAPRYPEIAAMLAPVLQTTGNTVKIER